MYNLKNFPNQKENEKILMFLRRHWVEVFKIILISLGLLIVPLAFYLVLIGTAYLENELYYSLYILINSSYILFVVLFAFSNFIDYYLDVWIITDERVVNIEQKGLFNREVSEKELGRMQDITSEVKGFWATIFKYGDIHMQTAAEEQRFVFKQIPHAEEVTRKISNLVAEHRRQNPDLYDEVVLPKKQETEMNKGGVQ